MRIRPSIFGFVAIIAVLIALMLWFGRKKSVETPPVSLATNVAPGVVVATSQPASAPVHSNAPVAQPAPSNQIPTPPLELKEQQIRGELATYNDVGIFLRAQVVDQFGAPVPGAAVSAAIGVNNGKRVGQDRLSTVTDGNGFFTISGHKGKDMGITVLKNGYVMATTSTYFVYSYLWPASRRFTPDPNNPVVIKMWKLQGAEPLVSINQHYKLPYTSTLINIDLVAGTIVPAGGDVRITVNRPAGEVSEHNAQDWGFEIEAVDGGIMEASDASMTYVAPENGYQPSDTLTASSNRNGIGGIQQSFFLESRNGQIYSKFGMIFGINKMPDGLMDITFNGVANTNGDGNWEATAPQ